MPKSNVTSCPAETTLELIGGRWKVLILWVLFKGPHRLSDLKARMEDCVAPGESISQRVLIRQLRELEEDELITRTISNQIPSRVDYQLTPLGQSLDPVMEVLITWGKNHRLQKSSPEIIS
ncbi:MAG: helix-turn-helix transcriptional regulator [Cyanobacteria bacterium]|nr:helix-turn-helix transcriptional regulator [Cyanobacteriota bacterium]